jgi:hypothetical protein
MDPRFKVAIPRLERREPERKEPDKHRVVKACNSCRKRKVKCSGENPRCRNCIESKSTCIYPQARKDRLKEWVYPSYSSACDFRLREANGLRTGLPNTTRTLLHSSRISNYVSMTKTSKG